MEVTAEFTLESPRASLIYQAVLPELEDQPRSRVVLHCTDEGLHIQIRAEDITALRAALNSWLRLIKIAHELSNPML